MQEKAKTAKNKEQKIASIDNALRTLSTKFKKSIKALSHYFLSPIASLMRSSPVVNALAFIEYPR